MKTYVLCAMLLTSLFPVAHGGEVPPTIQLLAGDKQVDLPGGMQAQLSQQVTDLVRSSNFHSGPGDKYHIFTFTGVQQDYRDTVVTGDYLLIILSPAQTIETTGGEITAAEIVIGLRGSIGKNTVFTIDEAGTIIGHAKYSGEKYLEIKKSVAQARQ